MLQRHRDRIKLSGTIDMTAKPAKVTIAPSNGDPWIDFGYWLEATSFMAYQAMQAQGWDKQQIKSYIDRYLDKAVDDYLANN